MQRRVTAASLRATERREREAAQPLLSSEAPGLVSLNIQFDEHVSMSAPVVSYVRRVVVPVARAHFEVGCGDPSCNGGGHDLTYEIVRALRDRKHEFSGEDACRGSIGTASCPRVLRYRATAEYNP